MNQSRLSKQLDIDEGRKPRMYLDSVGKWTGGVGRNLSDKPFRDDEIDLMLKNDIEEAVGIARQLLPRFDDLDDVRQEVVANMAFNLGYPRLSGFKKFLAAVNAHNFQRASAEMQDSLWYRQVGARAKRLAKAMLEGRFE